MRRTHYVKYFLGAALDTPCGVRVLKMDGPSAQGFLSLTALRAEGCGIALSGDEYKVSVTGLAVCVI